MIILQPQLPRNPLKSGCGRPIANVELEVNQLMSNLTKSAIPAAILAAGMFWVSATPIYATVAYAKTEGKACTYCHVTNGSKELNAGGKYYAAHDHSLKGYTPAK